MMTGSMSQIWGIINGLQVLVYAPLFDVKFPELSNSVLAQVIILAKFDLIPEDTF